MRLPWMKNGFICRELYAPFTVEKDIDYIIPNSFYEKNIWNYVYNGKIVTLEKKDKTFDLIAEEAIK